MKLSSLLAAASLSLAALTQPAMAQTMDHGKMGMTQDLPMVDAEVRRVDKENGKVTLKHGAIKNMDMPPMTMVFTARDKAMLEGIAVGDKVQFTAVNEKGQMLVESIKAIKPWALDDAPDAHGALMRRWIAPLLLMGLPWQYLANMVSWTMPWAMGWEAIVADAMSEVRDDGMVDGSGYYCNNSATWRAPVRSAKPMPHVYPPATGRR